MMRRLLSSKAACPSCAPRPLLSTPWPQQQRSVSVRRTQPSRMVLADNVGRAPPGATNRPRTRREGPFGGLNRTVANLDPRDRKAAPRSADGSGRGSNKTRGKDERKALKMQRALTPISYGRRNLTKERMAENDSFETFGLLPVVKEALLGEVFKGMVDVKPTPVQRLAIPALLGEAPEDKKDKKGLASDEMESFLLAAETGSGKTLAYLLPAIHAIKTAEAGDESIRAWRERRDADRAAQAASTSRRKRAFDEPHPTMARPKAVILVPTAELAGQVARVAKQLSHVVKFKACALSSTMRAQQIQRELYSPLGVDLVVSTPHLLASVAESDPNVLSRVAHLVVDEADSLLDRSFAPATTAVVERAAPSTRRLVCCSATIPRKMNNYLATTYPRMRRITTPNLHAIPRRVQLGVVDVSREPYRNNKDLACADALYTIGREAAAHEGPVKDRIDVRRVIVFVNEREKTEQVAQYLRTKGIHADALHRDTPETRHGEIIDMFTSNEALTIPAPAPSRSGAAARKLPNVRALVVTDLASRGIDTLAVRHVILYDVPHTTIDFIHRLGRAGRMGRRGRGIVLAGNDDRKDIIAEVKRSMFMGQALI